MEAIKEEKRGNWGWFGLSGILDFFMPMWYNAHIDAFLCILTHLNPC